MYGIHLPPLLIVTLPHPQLFTRTPIKPPFPIHLNNNGSLVVVAVVRRAVVSAIHEIMSLIVGVIVQPFRPPQSTLITLYCHCAVAWFAAFWTVEVAVAFYVLVPEWNVECASASWTLDCHASYHFVSPKKGKRDYDCLLRLCCGFCYDAYAVVVDGYAVLSGCDGCAYEVAYWVAVVFDSEPSFSACE